MRFNRELEEAEDHYQRYQIRRKSTAIEAQTKKKGPTEEEQYDFFTKTWDDEPAAAVEERPQVAAEIEASAENQGMGGEVREEERKLLTKEVVGLRSELSSQITVSSSRKKPHQVLFRVESDGGGHSAGRQFLGSEGKRGRGLLQALLETGRNGPEAGRFLRRRAREVF